VWMIEWTAVPVAKWVFCWADQKADRWVGWKAVSRVALIELRWAVLRAVLRAATKGCQLAERKLVWSVDHSAERTAPKMVRRRLCRGLHRRGLR
jgi:hypothetical protein